MDALLLWQQKQVLVTLLFEGIRTSYLVHIFLEATSISGIICCHGHLVTMATEASAYKIVFQGIRASYLVFTFLKATAIFGITCCYGYLVIFAIETGAHNIAVRRYTNFIFGANVS